MGIGDNIMATGLAKGAAARGKRIAFGDGKKIRWDHNSVPIFLNNPNIAPPGQEKARDIEWVRFHKGHRVYNSQEGNRWVWHPDKFKATPGEIFFTNSEIDFARQFGNDFVVIEPNVPNQKGCAPNKQWPVDRFNEVVERLKVKHRFIQFVYPNMKFRLQGVEFISTPTFRHAAAVLKNAKAAILPEGGLHHAAAAVGTKAVVLFGGFIHPGVTGYGFHINLTGGAEACGSLNRCEHCVKAMEAISVDQVVSSFEAITNG